MSQRSDKLSMRHMLDHAAEAVQLAQGRQRQDLSTDRILELALTRLLEIVGEAAARVSVETRELYPTIVWQQIVGLRNRLIHGYDRVDLDILWQIVQGDLPCLVSELERILGISASPPESDGSSHV